MWDILTDFATYRRWQVGPQVDQQVAAADQVHVRKRRIDHDVLRRERDHLAQVLAHLEEAVGRDEEAAQPLPADGRLDGLG